MADGESLFITASDGLRLHARRYGPKPDAKTGAALPVVCLPGLARTSADFEPLAAALSAERPVIAVDYRGRGLSDYDSDPAKYNVAVELADTLAVTNALNVMPAVIVGTSRGGILAMLMAAAHPQAIAGVVLNDIGPVIEVAGLMRIKGYVGKLPQPSSYDDAAEKLRTLFSDQFPRLTAPDWLAAARRTFKAAGGRLVPTYDAALAKGLEALTPDTPLPVLWDAFDALAGKPVLVVRGALSDILSVETVAQMRVRHPGLDYLEIADQGHAPLLAEAEPIARIKTFIDAI